MLSKIKALCVAVLFGAVIADNECKLFSTA